MSRFFRALLLSVTLVAVAMTSAVMAMKIAIHGREVRVPKLTGLAVEQAEQVLAANELQLAIENRFFSERYAAGTILSQYPAAHDKVRRGLTVRVAVSLGGQRARVPEVTGESEHMSASNLAGAGFGVAHVSSVPMVGTEVGAVVAQSPEGGALADSPRVDLLLAASPDEDAWMMPELVGLPVAEALARLHAADAQVDVEQGASGTGAASGTVALQSPAAGAKLLRGASVRLTVAP